MQCGVMLQLPVWSALAQGRALTYALPILQRAADPSVNILRLLQQSA